MRLNLFMTVCNDSPASSISTGRKGLEVIVTSPEEALEAEQGGADRLEVVRSLDQGGLTPSLEVIAAILAAVRIPMRVMLRESDSMTISDTGQLDRLIVAASGIAQFPVQGLVTGFVHEGSIDQEALKQILPAAPGLPVTFHRAFEYVKSPLVAIAALKQYPQVDRILIRATNESGPISLAQAKTWQHFAAPQIRFILGVGLDRTLLPAIRDHADLWEVHVGRSVREPETVFGAVRSDKVAHLKSILL